MSNLAVHDLPSAIAELVTELANIPGAIAVVLGGSRADASNDRASDWDLGFYYRGAIDLSPLAARGTVHPPGSWGRVMNGGAWLVCGGERVDVLLRDLDVVDHWTHRAQDGEFEVDALLGYLAGVPTYLLTAELASCRRLHGSLAPVPFPPQLAVAAPPRWRSCRTFSLEYARALARRGNRIGAIGQTTKAILEEAHAVMCERGQWVCNEKRLIDMAGLADVHHLFTQLPVSDAALIDWIDLVAARLGVTTGETAPWSEEGREFAAGTRGDPSHD